MAHLLQPSDLTINGLMEEIEKFGFSEYFTDRITSQLIKNPEKDVMTIEVDLKLSILKPERKSNVQCI